MKSGFLNLGRPGFIRRGLGAFGLVLAFASLSVAQSPRRPDPGHRLVASPGALEAGVTEAGLSAREGNQRVANEYRGSLTSRASEALLGFDPLPKLNSMLQEASPQGERFTPNSVIRQLPSIDSRLGGGSNRPETIFGADDRVRINSTTGVPWRWTCRLVITMPDGKQYTGTGWLAGPRCVVTAGHCVHGGGRGKSWASRIEVIPGMNGSTRPYGTVSSNQFITVRGWTQDRNRDYDYGCIILPSAIGNSLGYFGFTNASDSTLRSMLFNTAGYPGDKSSGTMWFTTGRLSGLSARRIFTQTDIMGGQSGSAFWRLSNGSRHAVGIVAAEDPVQNHVVRINQEVFNNLLSWRNR